MPQQRLTQLPFAVGYRGPIGIVNKSPSHMEIVAMHTGQNVSKDEGHELTGSVQRWVTDTSSVPYKITEGTASFYTKDQRNMLFCTFEGSATPSPDNANKLIALVTATFTGGVGRFDGSSGHAIVKATLHLDEGYSEGVLTGGIFAVAP